MTDAPLERLVEYAQGCLPSPQSLERRVIQQSPSLLLLEQHEPSLLEASLYEPVLCLILQGRKEVRVGEQSLSFGRGECLLVSHNLPVRSRVTKAPYLALVFEIDLGTIRRLYDEVGQASPTGEPARSALTHRADAALLDALHRYMALAESPQDARVLRPLIEKELHYRLLVAPIGGMLRNLIRHDSSASAIARAIAHIRDDIRSPVVVPDLARRVGMSPSTFHKHFKEITSTTPLQYQKELRLLEARRLLRVSGSSVTAAAFDVGYESPSQFSREYARKFGVAPSAESAVAAS